MYSETYNYKIMCLLSELRNDQNDDSENGLSGAVIGGAIAGAVVFIAIIILLCIGIWFIKHSKQKQTSFPVDNSVYTNPG